MRIAASCVAWLFAFTAFAQSYPNRPVKVVVPWPPGQATDIAARVVAERLQSLLGQPFVVEGRPGAGSNVAAQHVARSPKDGHTLFVTTSSSTIRSPASANLEFDFQTDFAPIALVAGVPFVLTAWPGLGVRTVEEVVTLAKSNRQPLTFGADENDHARIGAKRERVN